MINDPNFENKDVKMKLIETNATWHTKCEIVAKELIKAGEEITVNYQDIVSTKRAQRETLKKQKKKKAHKETQQKEVGDLSENDKARGDTEKEEVVYLSESEVNRVMDLFASGKSGNYSKVIVKLKDNVENSKSEDGVGNNNDNDNVLFGSDDTDSSLGSTDTNAILQQTVGHDIASAVTDDERNHVLDRDLKKIPFAYSMIVGGPTGCELMMISQSHWTKDKMEWAHLRKCFKIKILDGMDIIFTDQTYHAGAATNHEKKNGRFFCYIVKDKGKMGSGCTPHPSGI